ncbi:Gnt-I system high-affinity gluconate transporter [Cyclobacterium lianum]|uniref:Gnt-I system high-affinity gluconate transporter n=1 Tax=Cyclobacterium lianum TaxID=388280 RepID=A0A1M7IIA1_9BACT|nr:gluconate:H+ symporter [Cyclobacterium lianum]SHM40395.1 Gnt-I system high-affinity gluconate transporter [Cyclobacterium lianum]
MTFVVVAFSILLLVLMIIWVKVEPFIAFLIASILTGLFLGIPLENIASSVQEGIGSLMGALVIVITLGAMLGKIVADSGAAQRIATFLMGRFGEHRVHWAIAITAFIVGIPLFFNVGFVLLVPLVFSVSYQYKIPAMAVGIPMLAALSVTHGLLPPHPGPIALVAQFDADMGATLVYGLILAIPMVVLAGPILGKWPFFQTMKIKPLEVFSAKPLPEEALPGLANSLFTALLPVFLLIALSLVKLQLGEDSSGFGFLVFISDPNVVMLISLIWATLSLGLTRGVKIQQIMEGYAGAVKDIALILLIIAGAGAYKEILVDSGVSAQIGTALEKLPVNPLLLGWLIAAVIRISVGSATVAALTAAGIIAPLVMAGGSDPNLMVLAIGSGSLIFSHVNDGGFWLVKEYFNLSIKQTFLSWTLLETVVAFLGLAGVLILDLFV